jgi:hypothetical protein
MGLDRPRGSVDGVPGYRWKPMGLFGNRDEKAAKGAAAQAETDRLVGLSAADLAIEVLPALGPEGINAGSGHRQGPVEVTNWLLAPFSKSVKYRQPVLGPVIEGLQVLEHAGLVERRSFGGGSTYHATRLGETALAEGSVRSYLTQDG